MAVKTHAPAADPSVEPTQETSSKEKSPPTVAQQEEIQSGEEPQLDEAATQNENLATGPEKQGADAIAGNESSETSSNDRENQVVHTRSVSIKGVLKGKPPAAPLADEEISEDDQVDKAVPPAPEKIEVTEEMIRKAWKAYAESIEKSHPRIFTTLSQQVPSLDEKGIIQISLNTEAQRENFVHRIKPELTRYFQKTIASIEYVFETNLIENETTVKKVYTDQDKLEFLIKKNPALEKMKSKFNLDFDD